MKTMEWMVALVVLATGSVGRAITVGDYVVTFNRADGRSGVLGDEGGWDCSSRMSTEFVESQRVDARGRPQSVRRTGSGTDQASLLHGARLSMGFQAQVDAAKGGAPATFYVTQECTESRTVFRQYYDFQEEKWKFGPATETATQRLMYKCEFGHLPLVRGKKAKANCLVGAPSQGSSTFTWSAGWGPGFNFGGIGEGPLHALRNIPFEAEVALTGTREQYAQDLCQASGKRKVVVRLSQGVEGRAGENDFQYTIQVDGGSPLVLKKRDGVIYDDILLCTDKDRVHVKVSAIEKDLFFSDRYVGDPTDRVSIPLSDRVNEGTVRLKRKRWTRTIYHDVRVTVFAHPEDTAGEGGRQLIAEAGTHR